MTAQEANTRLAARRPRAFDGRDGLALKTAAMYDWLAALAHVAYGADKLERLLGELLNSGLGELRRWQPEIERDARRARQKALRAAPQAAPLLTEGGQR